MVLAAQKIVGQALGSLVHALQQVIELAAPLSAAARNRSLQAIDEALEQDEDERRIRAERCRIKGEQHHASPPTPPTHPSGWALHRHSPSAPTSRPPRCSTLRWTQYGPSPSPRGSPFSQEDSLSESSSSDSQHLIGPSVGSSQRRTYSDPAAHEGELLCRRVHGQLAASNGVPMLDPEVALLRIGQTPTEAPLWPYQEGDLPELIRVPTRHRRREEGIARGSQTAREACRSQVGIDAPGRRHMIASRRRGTSGWCGTPSQTPPGPGRDGNSNSWGGHPAAWAASDHLPNASGSNISFLTPPPRFASRRPQMEESRSAQGMLMLDQKRWDGSVEARKPRFLVGLKESRRYGHADDAVWHVSMSDRCQSYFERSRAEELRPGEQQREAQRLLALTEEPRVPFGAMSTFDTPKAVYREKSWNY